MGVSPRWLNLGWIPQQMAIQHVAISDALMPGFCGYLVDISDWAHQISLNLLILVESTPTPLIWLSKVGTTAPSDA